MSHCNRKMASLVHVTVELAGFAASFSWCGVTKPKLGPNSYQFLTNVGSDSPCKSDTINKIIKYLETCEFLELISIIFKSAVS